MYKAGQYIALCPCKGGTWGSVLKGTGERKGPWDETARARRDGAVVAGGALPFCSPRLDQEGAWEPVAHYSTWLRL